MKIKIKHNINMMIFVESFNIPAWTCWHSQLWYKLSFLSLGLTLRHSPMQKILNESSPYFPIPYSSPGYIQLLDVNSWVNLLMIFPLVLLRPIGLRKMDNSRVSASRTALGFGYLSKKFSKEKGLFILCIYTNII